jgi:Tol biopolymer transport system component/tRNA A-37 threonylcarbamoyl transferase component Bud32
VIGKTLSHYRITAALGAGGMGEVYRATDTNLDREVAIKVLPPEVVGDPERLGRFKREAHLLAALNHPNIAAIYGLEEADGKPFLSLELVEGEDLKERLARGALPVDEALEIAEQVAEALEEAHNHGIVHRDLKPANVKLTPEGKVKVLDFGLAKAWDEDSREGTSSASLSQSPTLAHSGTAAGIILGTAAYMSPEQARGRPVDRKADVWSFGVLLWEMLTGGTLFTGDTVTDVIAAVVRQEVDLDALPTTTPHAVRRLMARCLRKDPRTRLPDIGAARLELQDVLAGTVTEPEAGEGGPGTRADRRSRTRERATWGVLALLLAGLSTVLIVQRLTDVPEPRPASHFILETPRDLDFGNADGFSFSPPAVSPDGRSIAFAAQPPPRGTYELFIRALGDPEVRALPGTEGGVSPFWSPDGRSLGFVAGRELKKLDLGSGTVQTLCRAPRFRIHGATWSAEETIVFSTGGFSRAELYSVSSAGGEAQSLGSPDESRGELSYRWPQVLPDGRQLIFEVRSDDPAVAGTYVTSLDAPAGKRRILPGGGRVLYAPPGHLLYERDARLLAQRFDPEGLVTTGEAIPIASDVDDWIMFPDVGSFSASASRVVTWMTSRNTEVSLEWVDRSGRSLGTLGEPGRYRQIALSPDNRRVAVEIMDEDGGYDIWAIDVARGVASRVTRDPGDERDPVWSPDSQELVFTSNRNGGDDVLRMGLKGSDAPSPLPAGAGATPDNRDIAEGWLSEGNTVLYLSMGSERTVWMVSLDASEPAEPLVASRQVDEPQVSPNGRWLAYISSESERYEVYVEPFRRSGETLRVSPDGGGQPRWRGDGKELFYLSLDGRLMSVDVREGSSGLEVSIPRVLTPADQLRAVVQGPDYDDYAVTSDGQRFLVKRSVGANARQRLHVLLDWPSLLE